MKRKILNDFKKKYVPYRIRVLLQEIADGTSSAIGALRCNRVVAYWWRENSNFGDLITPCLLSSYGFTPVWSEPHKSQLLATGSILGTVSSGYGGIILGSGAMYADDEGKFPKATVLAVRGKLTRDLMGLPEDTVLGDPGLLATRLLPKRKKKRYEIGVIPHYRDAQDPRVLNLAKRFKHEVKLIDVLRNPLDVFCDIDQCKCVLSSSLHGLIVADAFGIPTGWLHLSDGVEGKGFKFHDYYSSLGTDRQFYQIVGDESLEILKGMTKQVSRVAIENVQGQLDKLFRELKGTLEVVGNAGDTRD